MSCAARAEQQVGPADLACMFASIEIDERRVELHRSQGLIVISGFDVHHSSTDQGGDLLQPGPKNFETGLRSGCDEALYLVRQLALVDNAIGGQLEGAIFLNEHESGPATGAESLPEFAGLIVLELGESIGACPLNKACVVAPGGLSADANELDLVTECCFDLCDRRAFCHTRGSPRSPEPDDEVFVGE